MEKCPRCLGKGIINNRPRPSARATEKGLPDAMPLLDRCPNCQGSGEKSDSLQKVMPTPKPDYIG